MPKIVDADRQRAQIRTAARTVFAEKGLSGTGLAHVARNANVSRATLYHYYEDKSALVADIAMELLTEESALFESSLAGEGPIADRIDQLSQTIVDRFSNWSAEGGALLEIWIDQKETVGAAIVKMRKTLALLLQEGQAAGEIDITLDSDSTATLLIGLVDGLILQAYLAPSGLPTHKRLKQGLSDGLQAILKVGA